MKNLIIILSLLIFSENSFSQILENSNNNQFVCSVGLMNDSEYPFKTINLNYDSDIVKLSNGKRFPILSRIKSKVETDSNWVLVSKNDTTKIESIELFSKGENDAYFIVKGKDFSKSFDTEGLILEMDDNILIFRNKNGKEWTILRIK
jgi:hypothetical protein